MGVFVLLASCLVMQCFVLGGAFWGGQSFCGVSAGCFSIFFWWPLIAGSLFSCCVFFLATSCLTFYAVRI